MTTWVTSGDTVWLKGEFKDRLGAYADPDSVTVKIYDEGENLLTTMSATKTAVGKYETDYLVPLIYNSLIYEFTGTLSGYIATRRDTLDVQFAVPKYSEVI
jgi:hypothetical protein